MRKDLKHCLLAVLAGIALVGCGAKMAADRDGPDADVLARAGAYFDAMIAQDYRRAYEMLSPGYRETNSFSRYAQLKLPPGVYRDAVVERKECASEQVCDVITRVTFLYGDHMGVLRGTEVSMHLRERWLKVDGRWYLLPKD